MKAHFCMAKVCEPRVLSIHLSNLSLHYTGLWKCVIAQIKEISEDLRRRVADTHLAGKGCKTISKEFRLCWLPQEWLNNQDHTKSKAKVCNILEGHKGSQGSCCCLLDHADKPEGDWKNV